MIDFCKICGKSKAANRTEGTVNLRTPLGRKGYAPSRRLVFKIAWLTRIWEDRKFRRWREVMKGYRRLKEIWYVSKLFFSQTRGGKMLNIGVTNCIVIPNVEERSSLDNSSMFFLRHLLAVWLSQRRPNRTFPIPPPIARFRRHRPSMPYTPVVTPS